MIIDAISGEMYGGTHYLHGGAKAWVWGGSVLAGPLSGALLCGSVSVEPLLMGTSSVSPYLIGETTVTPLLTGDVEIVEC